MKNKRQVKVRKHINGLFEIRYTMNGKQGSVYGATAYYCREKYARLIQREKRQPKSKSMLFITWFDKYIALYKKKVLKTNTLKNLIGMFKLHILPYIAQKQLRRITSQDLQEIINNMQNIPRQQTIVYIQLNACFEQAFKLNLISHNPCNAILINKNKGNKGKALTKEQEKKLIEYLQKNNPPITNLIYLYLTTGMRRNELINIEYKDLNFKDSEIIVRGTKTDKAQRTIQVKQNILELFPKQDKPFATWTASKVNHAFKDIINELKIKGITIHSLRHTFATRCIESGVDMVVVQKWLGHASITMTIDTYTHIEQDYKQQSANILDYKFLYPKNTP